MVPTVLYVTRWTKLQVSISCIWENKNLQTDYNNNVYGQLGVFTLSSRQTVVSKPELAWRQLGCRIEGLIHIQWKGTAGKRVNCCRIWRQTYGNYFRKGSLASVRVYLLSYFYADSSLSSRTKLTSAWILLKGRISIKHFMVFVVPTCLFHVSWIPQ